MSVGWPKVRDEALDRGPTGSLASLSILKLLCKTVFADRKCPVELCTETIPSGHALINMATIHLVIFFIEVGSIVAATSHSHFD